MAHGSQPLLLALGIGVTAMIASLSAMWWQFLGVPFCSTISQTRSSKLGLGVTCVQLSQNADKV